MPLLDTLLAKVVGTQNERELKRLRPIVGAGQRASSRRSRRSSDEQLRAQDGRVPPAARRRRERSTTCCPRSFAVVREAGRRVLNMRHFDVQLIGGAGACTQGKIAEMKTGEGKTLVATLPAYLNALEGKGVHVVTVNDYLAAPRLGVDGPDLPLPRHDGRRHPARPERRRAAGRLRRRHHLRHEQRVRLRLPARQHEVRARRTTCSAGTTSRSSTRWTASSSTKRGRRSSSPVRPRNRPICTTKSIASSRGSRPARSCAATPRPRSARRSKRPATTSATRSTRRSR